MSYGPDPQQPNVQLVEETRKQINRLIEEVARLAEMDLAPGDFYGEFLKRIQAALTAPAAAVWGRTAQGNLQLQYQINMRQVGLDQSEEGRASHDELLRRVVTHPQSVYLMPYSSTGAGEGGGPTPGNPTGYLVLLVPIVADNQTVGLIEVWQSPDRHSSAIRGFLQFMEHMAELASRYTRNHMLRQMVGQQQLWTQMESFARQIHGSLHTTEVAYLIANEGRRLIDCDRVSVGVRYGKRVFIEAVSGADVVEKRSNLVQLMRKLLDRVLKWGEKLVYTGSKDDTLPPDVLQALDAYLAESNSKLLVVLPLKDERESESKKPPRSALIMECFEPQAAPEQLQARLEVVGRHATGALYNAVEHRRIPMRFIWMPIARVQEGLGGKARAITILVAAVLAVLLFLMVVPPWLLPLPGQTLKMSASGQLMPVTRRYFYPTREGRIVEFMVKPGETVAEDHELARMYDQRLHLEIIDLDNQMTKASGAISLKQARLNSAPAEQKAQIEGELAVERTQLTRAASQRQGVVRLNNAQEGYPGYFFLKAPKFPHLDSNLRRGDLKWTVLNDDFKENLTHRLVKPSDPLLRLGYKDGPWEIELKIPQKHIGQVLNAFEKNNKQDLDVDLLVLSAPTRTFKGKLAREKIGGQAEPRRDDNNETEPVVVAYVRIEGDDIKPEDSLASESTKYLLVTGTEVHAKIRCGQHQLGYSLFYGVWEFFYEKVVFFF